ncbi:MAG TPA: toxin-antitoxin system, antitoxin component, Xre family protein [Hyphomonadaceae bacterium]|nr:toxin-antitoxin system, antitoxin component, Xre family protein [Hyphomonadaceae bacterium]
MADNGRISKALIEKIGDLPSERIAEVEDFVDFMRARYSRALADASLAASEPAFAQVWGNPEDDAYDAL